MRDNSHSLTYFIVRILFFLYFYDKKVLIFNVYFREKKSFYCEAQEKNKFLTSPNWHEMGEGKNDLLLIFILVFLIYISLKIVKYKTILFLKISIFFY